MILTRVLIATKDYPLRAEHLAEGIPSASREPAGMSSDCVGGYLHLNRDSLLHDFPYPDPEWRASISLCLGQCLEVQTASLLSAFPCWTCIKALSCLLNFLSKNILQQLNKSTYTCQRSTISTAVLSNPDTAGSSRAQRANGHEYMTPVTNSVLRGRWKCLFLALHLCYSANQVCNLCNNHAQRQKSELCSAWGCTHR